MVSFRDWVVETSSTTGTSAYALSGSAPAGTSYFTFRQRYANGEDEIVYWVVNADRTKWEKNRFGTLTYGAPDTLSRNVVESTNGDAPVSWVGGDTPLRIYVVPDADAEEFAITMGLGAARPGVLKYGLWAEQDKPSAGLQTVHLFDGASDIPFAVVDPTAHTFSHLAAAIQVFDLSGTYTPDPKMVFCIIEVVGGAGGSGGVDGTTGESKASAGGGSGSYSRTVASAADIGASQTVTIGAGGTAGTGSPVVNGGNGGDTSVGSLCIGKGGSGSTSIAAAGVLSTAGAGGVAGTGDVTIAGNAGGVGSGASITTVAANAGSGGASYFGGAPRGVQAGSSNVVAGIAGTTGSGASGAAAHNSDNLAAGAAGGNGRVVITEFLRV